MILVEEIWAETLGVDWLVFNTFSGNPSVLIDTFIGMPASTGGWYCCSVCCGAYSLWRGTSTGGKTKKKNVLTEVFLELNC